MSHFFRNHPDASIRKAYAFANMSHAGMKRFTGKPYIIHPATVARLLMRFEHDVNMVCAALLHDVKEDCGVSLDQIRDEFDEDTASLVDELSDISRKEDGSRAVRRAIDLEHTASASPRAKTIKCMDITHNVATVVQVNPRFAETYLPEKAATLARIADASDPRAHALAMRVLERAKCQLEQLITEESTLRDSPLAA